MIVAIYYYRFAIRYSFRAIEDFAMTLVFRGDLTQSDCDVVLSTTWLMRKETGKHGNKSWDSRG
jgi:hypothetical protein